MNEEIDGRKRTDENERSGRSAASRGVNAVSRRARLVEEESML